MRALRISIAAAAIALLATPAAHAHVLHTVTPGETLWTIAAQSNLTTRTVAASAAIGKTNGSSRAKRSARTDGVALRRCFETLISACLTTAWGRVVVRGG